MMTGPALRLYTLQGLRDLIYVASLVAILTLSFGLFLLSYLFGLQWRLLLDVQGATELG